MMYLFDKEKKAISVFSKQICVFFIVLKKLEMKQSLQRIISSIVAEIVHF